MRDSRNPKHMKKTGSEGSESEYSCVVTQTHFHQLRLQLFKEQTGHFYLTVRVLYAKT